MAYTVEKTNNRILVRGDGIPIDDLTALSTLWASQGIDTLVPSIANAGKALLAVCPRDEVDAWRAEINARATQNAAGDAELAWLNGADTGTSSKTIFSVLANDPNRKFALGHCGSSIPHDPADFGRCHRLLALFPEWRSRLYEVVAKYPAWQGLVENWHELTALYLEELPSGRCPKLYKRMNELIAR